MTTDRPDKVNIMGTPFKIEYAESPLDVDPGSQRLLDGVINFWTCVIRIHDKGRPVEDLWKIIFHEVLHGIEHYMKIQDVNDDDIDKLAAGLTDVLFRNGWLSITQEGLHGLHNDKDKRPNMEG
jgi:hypothetical protein